MEKDIFYNLLSGALGAIIVFALQYFTENKKKRYERRLHILRALITNAMNIVSIDFVSALNMILVEYKSNSEVRKRHESFIEWACSPLPSNSDEAVLYNKKFDEILVRLIEEVAKSINIKIEQLDIANKIYWPKGFGYAAEKQQKLMELLIKNQEQWDVLLNRINNFDKTNNK